MNIKQSFRSKQSINPASLRTTPYWAESISKKNNYTPINQKSQAHLSIILIFHWEKKKNINRIGSIDKHSYLKLWETQTLQYLMASICNVIYHHIINTIEDPTDENPLVPKRESFWFYMLIADWWRYDYKSIITYIKNKNDSTFSCFIEQERSTKKHGIVRETKTNSSSTTQNPLIPD